MNFEKTTARPWKVVSVPRKENELYAQMVYSIEGGVKRVAGLWARVIPYRDDNHHKAGNYALEEQAEANAYLIVAAVNSHDRLVKACVNVARRIENLRMCIEDFHPVGGKLELQACLLDFTDSLREIREALAAAKGEQ